jgi:hypothetical protein
VSVRDRTAPRQVPAVLLALLLALVAPACIDDGSGTRGDRQGDPEIDECIEVGSDGAPLPEDPTRGPYHDPQGGVPRCPPPEIPASTTTLPAERR